MVKGRQMLWLLFQNYQVDHATLSLYKAKQLRELKLHKILPAFLNVWQEHIVSMEVNQAKAKSFFCSRNKLEVLRQCKRHEI